MRVGIFGGEEISTISTVQPTRAWLHDDTCSRMEDEDEDEDEDDNKDKDEDEDDNKDKDE